MLNLDLMSLFNGFIKNYENFDLNKRSSNCEIIKMEAKYFIRLGQVLGYSVIHRGLNIDNKLENIEVLWNECNPGISKLNLTKLQLLRETDLMNDLLAIQMLLRRVRQKPDRVYIQILETSSDNRIDYLNNIVNTSRLKTEKDILLIYVIRDILNINSYYKAYLFENGKVTKSKLGVSYCDMNGDMKSISRKEEDLNKQG